MRSVERRPGKRLAIVAGVAALVLTAEPPPAPAEIEARRVRDFRTA